MNGSDPTYKNGVAVTPNDDSFTKVDSLSLSDAELAGIDKLVSDRLFRIQLSEIRFTPNVLEFCDAFQGKQYCEKVVIQNVGRNPVTIKVGEPSSFIFQLKKPSRRNIFLASGASITRVVTYTYHNDDLVQKSRIPIYINGKRIDYPIVVKKAVPELHVHPAKIDFGTINLGSEVKALLLTIHNTGGTRTKFEIDLGKNDLDLVVNPLRGTIKAKQTIQIVVEVLGVKEGDFFREIWIKNNQIPIRIPVLVEVVRPRLLVVFPNGTEEFSAIDFPPTFIGAQRAVPFILKNRGGETALFVVGVQEEGTTKFISEARKTNEVVRFFKLTAEDGRLEPHESRVLTAMFRPEQTKKTKGWHHQEKMKWKPQSEYIIFLSISRVHCVERKELENSLHHDEQIENRKSSLSLRLKKEASRFEAMSEQISRDVVNFKEKEFRLCLRGKSVSPEILVQPTKFYFGNMHVGETKQKVLMVTNKSIIKVKCLFQKKMNVTVTPKEVWVKPEKTFEFSVSVTPTCSGNFNLIVKMQVLGESDVVYATDEALSVVAEHSVSISFTSVTPTKTPVPKIGLGITPLITDDVGINKELVSFSKADQVPYAAKLLSLTEEYKPNWMKTKLAKVEDAMMALPNDQPRQFQTWPKDKICKTIFKGFPRYAPPKDPTYTLSSQEQLVKKQNNAIFINYLLMLREMRDLDRKKTRECMKLLKSCFMENLKQNMCSDEELFKTFRTVIKKSSVCDLQKCLVPLSPTYLSCVIVEPKMMNFGMVALDDTVSANLKIRNENLFAISVKFVPRNSVVTVNDATVTVNSNSEKTISVNLQMNILGRYYGFLNYVINGSHEFKVTISAFIMSRTVMLEQKSLLFCNYPVNQAFQPRTLFLPLDNWLQTPVRYKFEFSTDSPYFAVLDEGEIPPRSTMQSEIVFGSYPKRPLTAELKIISESGSKEIMKISQTYKKLPVGFITNQIDLKDIPLNLKTKVTPIVENECFHDVTFEVINATPMPGVTVEPRSGTIRSRSFFPLNVQIQIPIVMKFTFDLEMIVQNSNNISVKISGNVVLPVIVINPSVINMRKICAQSFDSVMICLENAGTTASEIDIDFKSCPEYTVLDNKSHFYLRPKQATSIIIKFEPNDIARYVFYLPIIINNILGPPMMQENESEKVSYYLSQLERLYEVFGEVHETDKTQEKIPLAIISCVVSSSLITVSPTSIDFGPMEKKSTAGKESIKKFEPEESLLLFGSKNVTISNETTNPVTLCIRTDDLGKINDSPFDLQPMQPRKIENRLKSMKATLEPGEYLEFKATFSPKKAGKYNIQVPIYVRGYNNGMVYCYISLSGQVHKPNLIPEAREIHFSPIPLNVSSELTFRVLAENYTKFDIISCQIYSGNDTHSHAVQCLTTKWLSPPEVSVFNRPQSFTIQIIFKSTVPIVLRCYLVFVDTHRNYCSVRVTAAADNSSITTHGFLAMKTAKYKLVRSNCKPFVWKADDHPVLFYPFDTIQLKQLYKTEKKTDYKCTADGLLVGADYSAMVDIGPNLVVQGSTTRSNVGLVNPSKFDESSSVISYMRDTIFSGGSLVSQIKSSVLPKPLEINENFYPNYPTKDSFYKKYFDGTLQYVERWMYEVVMKCDQYFIIPWSFYVSRDHLKSSSKAKSRKKKDVVHFLEEIYGDIPIRRLENVEGNESPFRWALRLVRFYNDILRLLESQGCLLPHIKPEYLLPYDDYVAYTQTVKNRECIRPVEEDRKFSMKVSVDALGKPSEVYDSFTPQTSFYSGSKYRLEEGVKPDQSLDYQVNPDTADTSTLISESRRNESAESFTEDFFHKYDILEENIFNARSTQAWLDIIIQIFRHEVLTKVVFKSTIPAVNIIEPGEKLPIQTLELLKVTLNDDSKIRMIERDINSLYSIQERTLLLWLNHHLNIQKELIWGDVTTGKDKVINNFHKDLSDSLALISVTASYCPYVVPEFFDDCFWKPDTPVKLYHNAARLVQAWRQLSIGLTVETTDIVKPNNIFMVMLLIQLYEVLPGLHPRYLLCFKCPLSSQQTRRILIESEEGKILFQPKIMGADSQYFRLANDFVMEVKKGKIKEVKVTFLAQKIKKMRATLLLSACEESPFFGKNLAIFLEGELSELTESEKLSFSAPLYKVICTEILIKPLYTEVETYDIWYSTAKPVLSDTSDFVCKCWPWSKIRDRKVCRRLFLNMNEVKFDEGLKKLVLNVTIACLTHKDRLFWLLFRSRTKDFMVRVKIKSKMDKMPRAAVNCWLPDFRMECQCTRTEKDLRINWADMRSCPLLTLIKLPVRNENLWKALQTMFLKSVLPQEKAFWSEYFETDIGLCIIKWLLSPNEEEEVIDEFLPLLQTQIAFTLAVSGSKKKIKVLPQFAVKDARENAEVEIPVHVEKGLREQSQVFLEMVSETKMEVRIFKLRLQKEEKEVEEEEEKEKEEVEGQVQREEEENEEEEEKEKVEARVTKRQRHMESPPVKNSRACHKKKPRARLF